MNITTKDLNLLNIFVVLLEELNLSKAGKRLGLSQPAVSHALSRLRNDFDEVLFSRASKGMVPTNRALELEPIVRRLLSDAQKIYINESFNPLSASGSVVIAGTDYIDFLLLPYLMAKIATTAPHIQIITKTVMTKNPRVLLERGEADIAMAGFFPSLTGELYKTKLFDESFVGMARKGHPIFAAKAVSIEQYCNYQHILITPHGTMEGVVDEALADLGCRRNLSVGVANFQTPGRIVQNSDLILTGPKRLINAFEEDLGVRSFKLPFQVEGFTVNQIWHERTHLDPLHQWVREQISEISRSL